LPGNNQNTMNKGDKVVCINDDFAPLFVRVYRQLPKKGDIYTIREVCLRRETIRGSDSATVALLLEELKNDVDPTHKGGEELAFKQERFAPLETLEEEEEIDAYAPAQLELQPT
jgi:hypothetical protein